MSDAYGALAARLADGGGKYFFGDKPSSLDALAFAHLAFHAHSPVGDAMRGELKKHPALVAYVNDMQATLFPGKAEKIRKTKTKIKIKIKTKIIFLIWILGSFPPHPHPALRRRLFPLTRWR